MITVSQAVFDQLQKDELVGESLKSGLLNLSAYADNIHDKIEKATFKTVKRGTIVVALSRIAKSLPSTPPLKPDVKIENISVKAPLILVSFDKTMDIKQKIATLNPFLLSLDDLFTAIEGVSEVTLFINPKAETMILKHMGIEPKKYMSNLVGITISFNEKNPRAQNFFYGLFASFAPKRIQIEEIISTPSELSFILKKEGMEEAIKILNLFS